jgi:hypothetical protein
VYIPVHNVENQKYFIRRKRVECHKAQSFCMLYSDAGNFMFYLTCLFNNKCRQKRVKPPVTIRQLKLNWFKLKKQEVCHCAVIGRPWKRDSNRLSDARCGHLTCSLFKHCTLLSCPVSCMDQTNVCCSLVEVSGHSTHLVPSISFSIWPNENARKSRTYTFVKWLL